MSTAPIGPSHVVPSLNGRRRWLLLALVWAPFLSLFVFAAPFWGGDTYSHALFHVFAIALLGWAFVELRAVRPSPTSRALRVLTLVLSVSLPLAIVGHVAELVTAVERLVDEGWANVDTDDLFEEGAHARIANITVPMMLLSMLTTLGLIIVTMVQGRRSRETVEPEVPSRL